MSDPAPAMERSTETVGVWLTPDGVRARLVTTGRAIFDHVTTVTADGDRVALEDDSYGSYFEPDQAEHIGRLLIAAAERVRAASRPTASRVRAGSPASR